MFRPTRSSSRSDGRRQRRQPRVDQRVSAFFKDLSQVRLSSRSDSAGQRSGGSASQRFSAGSLKRSGNGASRRTKMKRETHSDERSFPPVMVRGGMPGVLPQTRKTVKTRRRYDVSLNVPGAEMRLPALPQVRFGLRILSGTMVILLSLGLYQLWNSPGYRVDEAEVSGLQRLNSADVNTVLDLEGESIFTLDAGLLEEKLMQAFPEFSSVSVDVALRDRVLVEVEERLPILTWRQDGQTVLVDADGYAFPQRDEAGETPALTVEAFSSPPAPEMDLVDGSLAQFMPVEMLSAILSMRGQAPADAVLVYDAQHGLGWKDAQGWEVYFGDVSEMGMKLSIFQSLAARLQQDGVTPVLVSVEHVHAPYYRLER